MATPEGIPNRTPASPIEHVPEAPQAPESTETTPSSSEQSPEEAPSSNKGAGAQAGTAQAQALLAEMKKKHAKPSHGEVIVDEQFDNAAKNAGSLLGFIWDLFWSGIKRLPEMAGKGGGGHAKKDDHGHGGGGGHH